MTLALVMTLAMLAASTTAAAEQARALRWRTPASAVDSSRAERQKAGNLKAFRGVAAKLNTTPAALQNAFEVARAGNPKLSRGNFIAANMLADNLGAQHPNITTRAILSGLQSGQSIGQTLQRLGLSANEAKQARKLADRQTKDGNKHVAAADKRARQEQRAQRRNHE